MNSKRASECENTPRLTARTSSISQTMSTSREAHFHVAIFITRLTSSHVLLSFTVRRTEIAPAIGVSTEDTVGTAPRSLYGLFAGATSFVQLINTLYWQSQLFGISTQDRSKDAILGFAISHVSHSGLSSI